MTPRRLSLLLLIAAVTLGRLLAAHFIPLTEDEAYYRLWAQHLHLGYYDHPPMIAWWIALGTQILGDQAIGIRLLPVLAAGLASMLVCDITQTLSAEPRTGFRAALWYNATITIGAGGILATPDAAAVLFWVATLWSLTKIWSGRSPRWWVLAGVTAGLACISKYSSLFLGPGVFLWMCLAPQGRKSFTSPWPWIAMAIAAGIFSTNVFWNAQNDWLTFAKQFGRVSPHQFSPKHLGDLFVSQFFLLGPVVAIYFAKGLGRTWRREGPYEALLLPLATSLPFAAYLVLHGLHDRVQAHWPAPLVAGIVIVAVIAAERSKNLPATRSLRTLGIGIWSAISVSALTYAAIAPNASLGRVDPILPIRGWIPFARAVEALRVDQNAAWVGTVSYGAMAQLSAARATSVPIIQVIERARYRDQVASPDLTRPGLLVDLSRRLHQQDLARCFAKVGPVIEMHRGLPNGPNAAYAAYLVSGPRSDLIAEGCPNELGKNLRR